jgi:hypothetical protein
VNIVCVALGKQYEQEAQRLLSEYPETILITEETEGVEKSFEIPILNGLATKCKFGLLIPKDLKGPILLCDADLVPKVPNPLQYFSVKEETDIAYVVYPGVWHFPKHLKDFETAIRKVGKINSGFMYFKNIDIARSVCEKWHKKYLERMLEYKTNPVTVDRTGEYDEPSLCLILAEENYNLEFLDPKWNVWGNEITIKHNISYPIEECYFRQQHLENWDPYQAHPTIY